MANYVENPDSVIQNLEDAGCDAETVEKYFQLRQAGKIRDQQRLLSKQRRLLLEALHANQRKIDNLDYLLYTLKTTPRSS